MNRHEITDLVTKVENENPLEMEYSSDARYIWPKRWKSLIDALYEYLNVQVD